MYDQPGQISTKVVDLEMPEPGPGEVLVNLYAADVRRVRRAFMQKADHLAARTREYVILISASTSWRPWRRGLGCEVWDLAKCRASSNSATVSASNGSSGYAALAPPALTAMMAFAPARRSVATILLVPCSNTLSPWRITLLRDRRTSLAT